MSQVENSIILNMLLKLIEINVIFSFKINMLLERGGV